MLSGLAVCAAITAGLAGVAGAWSPCGFSMVETIGSALGDARRGATLLASGTFALGTLIGGAATFGGLAFAGALAGHGASGLREGLGAALASAAAIADWRGVKIAPQIRRQVPERWRWTLPLPLACALYGILLGLGFTTFVLAFAVWALAGISFAAGDPLLGALIGLAFGAGRALPVLWMAPGLRGGRGAARLEEMASEPRLWLGLRRLDALGLGLCALALGGASASAALLPSATDPSAAGEELAWQQLRGPGMLLGAAGAISALPGSHPALGQASIAWADAAGITVADRGSLQQRIRIPVMGVNALAVSDSWTVFRDQDAQGAEHLIGVSLDAPFQRRLIDASRRAAVLGRPALDGTTVVFAIGTPDRSAIEAVELTSGRRRALRAAGRGAAFANPSMLDGALLFERTTRCVQQLLVGPAGAPARDRVLRSLSSTVRRDSGYQRGYQHAYNRASGCRNRPAGVGVGTVLGPTALGASAAYVTEISVPSLATPSGDAEIVAIPR
ncbi:MAG TPA: hypothetical protein VK538_10340 [Solirubrobacteraceae bacterium]|nr:hypothetical protein [Solirubrobacteraceae bacterium]